MRKKDDNYPTEDSLALLICKGLATDGVRPNLILEPSCGSGAFLRAARTTWPEAALVGMELDPERAQDCRNQGFDVITIDALGAVFTGGQFVEADLVLGNPPYKQADGFVNKFFPYLSDTGRLVYLLRLGFLSSQSRYRRLWSRPGLNSVQVLPKRPSFTGDGRTDMTEYGVYTWSKGYSGLPVLSWLDNREV